MRIKILNNYGGKLTGERRILPGEYEDNDPALFGVSAQYLIDNGHAIKVLPDGSQQAYVDELTDRFRDQVPPGLAAVAEMNKPSTHTKSDVTHQFSDGTVVEPEDPPALPEGVLGEIEPGQDSIPHAFSDMSLDELYHQLEIRGIDELEAISDLDAHWKSRHAELVAYLESLEDNQ